MTIQTITKNEIKPKKHEGKEFKTANQKHEKLIEKLEERYKQVEEESEERVIEAIEEIRLYNSGNIRVVINQTPLENMDSFGTWMVPDSMKIKGVHTNMEECELLVHLK